MKLPNRRQAYVPKGKVERYLLNPEHPQGRSKARFFLGRGFTVDEPGVLEDALLGVASSGRVTETVSVPHGRKYVVEGEIETPAGGAVVVRTVWIVLLEEPVPRLVTAYPTPTAS